MNTPKTKQTKAKRGRPVNEKRHDEIIELAQKLFMELGYQATTMELIANKLGISKLTLYSRFKDKEALFSAAISARAHTYITHNFVKEFSDQPPQDSLFRIGSCMLQLILSGGAMNMERLLLSAGKQQKKLATIFYEAGPAKVKALIAAHLQTLHDKGQLSIDDTTTAAHIFCALFKGSDIYMRLKMDIAPKPSSKEIDLYCREAVQRFMVAYAPQKRIK